MTHATAPAPLPTTAPPASTAPDDPDPKPFEPPVYLYFLVREISPDEDFELLVVQWVETKGHSRATAALFVNYLSDRRMLISAVRKLMSTIDELSAEADQAFAIELITNGAFTRRELKEPERITAFFARPDRAEILTAWRESRLPTINQVIQIMEAAQRRQTKKGQAPPPAPTGKGRGTRDALVSILKGALPSSLRKWATDLAEAVRALGDDPTVSMNATSLAAAVKLRRKGTGTKVCHRVITAGLPHLVQHGYVVMVDGGKARFRPGALV